MKGVQWTLIILVTLAIYNTVAYEGTWSLQKVYDQQVAIKNPIKFHISLQVLDDPKGTDKKLVRNRLQIQGCVAFTYLFKTVGNSFYLDISSYKFVKDKSRQCTAGQNSLMMLIYKSMKQVFKIQTIQDRLQMKGTGNGSIFSFTKYGSKKAAEQTQSTTSIKGLWQIYKVNKNDTGLRLLANITENQVSLCSDKVKIKYSLKSGGQFFINMNQSKYTDNKKECSQNEILLIDALEKARLYKSRGKFAAFFDKSISLIIQMKDVSQIVTIVQNVTPKIVQNPQKIKSNETIQGFVKSTESVQNSSLISAKPIKNASLDNKQKNIEKNSNQTNKQLEIPISKEQSKKENQLQKLQNQRNVKQKQIFASSILGKWQPKTIYNIIPPSSQVFILVSTTQILINGCNIHIFSFNISEAVSKQQNSFVLNLGNPISTRKACPVDDDSFFLRAMRMVKTGKLDSKNNQLILNDSSGKNAYLLIKALPENQKNVQVKQKKVDSKSNNQDVKLNKIDTQIAKNTKQIQKQTLLKQKQVVSEKKQKAGQYKVLPEGNFISMLLLKRALPRLYISLGKQNKAVLKGKCGQFSLKYISSYSGLKFTPQENSNINNECQTQKQYIENLKKCQDFEFNESQGIILLKDGKGENLVWMKNIK